MLEHTLATRFIPGTNLKGRVTGANWMFVLPQFELECVLCIGVPGPTTLGALAQFAQEVIVACRSVRESARLTREIVGDVLDLPPHVLCRIKPVLAEDLRRLDLPEHSVDVIHFVEQRSLHRLSRDTAWQTCVQRLLKDDGLIYAETRGPRGWMATRAARRRLRPVFGGAETMWLTPLAGEAHTFVPHAAPATRKFFLKKGVHSATFRWSRHRPRRVMPGKGAAADRRLQQTSAAAASPQSGSDRKASRRLQLARMLAGRLRTASRAAETSLMRFARLSRPLERCGVFLGRRAGQISQQPPEYLQAIARDAGIELSRYRWGLSAGGDYSSRKLVFFLFDGKRESGQRPCMVVKLTRDSVFNARLVREHDALLKLHRSGIRPAGPLPKALFLGQHGQRAVLGETAIDGVPFDRRTSFTADCSTCHAAVNWLIELAADTADSTSATADQAARGLQRLLARFLEIYTTTNDERAFLADQISILEHSTRPFPLVFQHGDPGRWNVQVDPAGQPIFLDWESAEPQGMPLWDLFYFLRSYCVGAARGAGVHDAIDGFASRFLDEEWMTKLVSGPAKRYCDRTGLPGEFVSPLFFTCWMHRALKEATRLVPNRLQNGHYVSLLRYCIAQRRSASFCRLLGKPVSSPARRAAVVPTL